MDPDLVSDLAHRTLTDVFGERDGRARAAAIEEIYAEDVTFADRDETVTGRAALDRKAQRLLDEAPGFVFTAAGEVRVARNLGHLAWHFGPPDGPPVVSGVDVSIVEDGRIAHLYTLLDPPA